MSYTPITDGTRATPDAFNSRFEELLYSGISVVNLQHPEFGAKLDGIANDTDAIRRAVEKAGENGVIYIPRGKKARIVETILLKQGQTVTGGGTVIFDPGVTVASGPFSNDGCTTVGGYDAAGNITISDIIIESETGNGLVFAHADGIHILGCRFPKWYWHAVDLIGCKNVVIGDCRTVNSVTSNPIGSAFQIDQAETGGTPGTIYQGGVETSVILDDTACQDVILRHNLIENSQSYGVHIHRTGHDSILVHGNVIRNCVRGVMTDVGATHSRVSITDNHILEVTNYGIGLESSFTGLTIRGNIIRSCENFAAILVHSDGGTSQDVIIADNQGTDIETDGIRLSNTTGFSITGNQFSDINSSSARRGIIVVNSNQGTITGNSLDLGVDQGGGGNRIGIYVVRNDAATLQNVTINGNHIRRSNTGIQVEGDSENVSVTGNTISVISDRGILLGDGTGAGTYTYTNCVVAGNTVHNFNRTGIVIEKPTQCVVSGNAVYDCVGTAVNGRGIQFFSTGTGNAIVGNVIDGVNSPAGSIGILVGCTYTIVAMNRVTRFGTGLSQESSPLTGVVYVGNSVRGNTMDSAVDAGVASGEQPFVFNWVGDQTNPFIAPPLQLNDSSGGQVLTGTGSPEGAVAASVGSIYLRTDGGAGTSLYVKESGSGNTGWAAK